MVRSFMFVMCITLVGCGKASVEQSKVDPDPAGPAVAPNPGQSGTRPIISTGRATTGPTTTRRASPPSSVARTPSQPTPAPKVMAIDEDPAVVEAFKAKNWKYGPERQIGDAETLIYLTLPDRPLSKADIAVIGKSRALQAINASKAKLSDADLKGILAAPRLEAISLGGDRLTDTGVASLVGAPNLTDVTFMFAEKVTAKGYAALSKLPKLRSLALISSNVSDALFASLAECKSLKSLTLQQVYGVTDKAAESIARYPALEHLKLSESLASIKTLSSVGIRAIAEGNLPAEFEFDNRLLDDITLKALVAKGWLYGPSPAGKTPSKPATAADVKSINLFNSTVTDDGFRCLLPCVNVEILTIGMTAMGDNTLKRLGAFSKLNRLSISFCPVTGAGLDALVGLPIEWIQLNNTTMTEAGFKALARLPELKRLSLEGAKMEAAWLSYLKGLAKLDDLDLGRAACNDSAAKELAAISSLTNLKLYSTELGDAGFEAILKLPKLKSLDVDNTKVTKEAFLKAEGSHPMIRLFHRMYGR